MGYIKYFSNFVIGSHHELYLLSCVVNDYNFIADYLHFIIRRTKVDIYENNAYEIQQELIRDYPNLDLKVLIASVRNENRINSIFQSYRPQIIYHAAAHKHVPLMEESPNEAIKNNVFGTLPDTSGIDSLLWE